ncbi:MAG: molybdenum cofactor guanylyltransferase [Vulcanibacillus sp.]
MEITGIILAGGKSSRMGKDKSILAIDNNQTLISNTVSILNEIFDEVIIISNSKNKYGFKNVQETSDIFLESGPLGGIHAGLSVSKNNSIFVVACDMPFLDKSLIEFLLEQNYGFDITVPLIRGRLEPLHAVYSKKCLPYIEDYLKRGIYKIIDFYPLVRVNYVNEESIKHISNLEKVFYNVNTPYDYNNIKSSTE